MAHTATQSSVSEPTLGLRTFDKSKPKRTEANFFMGTPAAPIKYEESEQAEKEVGLAKVFISLFN